MSDIYIQYGCGLSAPAQWLNFDASPRLRLESSLVFGGLFKLTGKRLFPPNVRYGDIALGLPVRDGSAAGVYASHVLEHLPRSAVPMALENTFRLLRKGGVFRMIVPDLAWRAKKYVLERDDGLVSAADSFIAGCMIGQHDSATGFVARLRAAYGNSEHKWMYDELVMKALMAEAGFKDVRVCTMGDSGDQMFDLVERADRFTDQGKSELALHAIRP